MIARHYDEGKERFSLQLKKLLERGTGFRQGEAKRGEWEGKSASSKSTGGARAKPEDEEGGRARHGHRKLS